MIPQRCPKCGRGWVWPDGPFVWCGTCVSAEYNRPRLAADPALAGWRRILIRTLEQRVEQIVARGGTFDANDPADRKVGQLLWPRCAKCNRRGVAGLVGAFVIEPTALGLRLIARCHGAEDVREVGPDILAAIRDGRVRLTARPLAFDTPELAGPPALPETRP